MASRRCTACAVPIQEPKHLYVAHARAHAMFLKSDVAEPPPLPTLSCCSLPQPHVPPQCGREVWLSVLGCHQPNLEPHVWCVRLRAATQHTLTHATLTHMCPIPRFADLVNVFDVFLPQLLRYPNPTDPLNGEAAALLLREPETYAARIKGSSHVAAG